MQFEIKPENFSKRLLITAIKYWAIYSIPIHVILLICTNWKNPLFAFCLISPIYLYCLFHAWNRNVIVITEVKIEKQFVHITYFKLNQVFHKRFDATKIKLRFFDGPNLGSGFYVLESGKIQLTQFIFQFWNKAYYEELKQWWKENDLAVHYKNV